MTTLAQYLPGIKDLGVSIVGEKCYESLAENLNIKDIQCIKHSLSKGLGLAIVVGGSIVKLPQLLLIVKARSARGLSLTSYMLETLSHSIALIYSLRRQYPISTYGENFFLTLQNTLITLLIIYYTPSAPGAPSKGSIIAAAGSTLVSVFTAMYSMDEHTLTLLQAATVPLGVIAKLPQIIQNVETRETGQLSAIVIAAQLLGSVARLFTTMHDVGDKVVAASFGVAILLNLVLLAQVMVYGKIKEGVPLEVKQEVLEKVKGGKEKASATGVQVSSQQAQSSQRAASPLPPRAATPVSKTSGPSASPSTPSSRAGTPSGSRKWSRKVD